jgi:outer membrane protein assembly factor BamB
VSLNLRADDWPQWGGPEHDLVWRESGIIKKFSTDGLLPRVWSVPIAEGYSGPAVADGKVYITDYLREERMERVLCRSVGNGDEIWTHSYPSTYTVSYPAGPRSTPVVDGDRVYTIGAMGDLLCLNGSDGKVRWKKNLPEEFGTKIASWGFVASPLVDGNQLITLVGGAKNSLVVSFDKLSGTELWRSLEDPEVGYAPPVIFTFGGIRQLIVWHPRAVSSIDPENGKPFWEIPFSVKAGLTIPTPRKWGSRLFVTAFYDGPLMMEVEGKSAKVLWKGKSNSEVDTDGLHSIMPTPNIDSDHIYGVCSYGQLRCLEATTGKRVWETYQATGKGRWWNAFLIPHEDRYFIHNEQGDLIIANLTPKGYEEISRAKLVEPTRPVGRRMTIWSHPAFAMKSVFARNDKELVRVDLSEK